MSHDRSVDLDGPDYLTGVRSANLMLDSGMGADVGLGELIKLAEEAAIRAHRQEDVPAYHRMVGMIHTLREYEEGKG